LAPDDDPLVLYPLGMLIIIATSRHRDDECCGFQVGCLSYLHPRRAPGRSQVAGEERIHRCSLSARIACEDGYILQQAVMV